MKTTLTTACKVLILCFTLPFYPSAHAQISMGTHINTYSQDFNGLPASHSATWKSGQEYLPGWTVYRTKADTIIVANNGSQNTGALYSYGTTGASERALGSIASTPAGSFTYNLLLQNNTGTTIESVDVKYKGEQWRISNRTAPQHVLSFWYAISSSPQAFGTSPTSDKGWMEVAELKFYGPHYFQPGTLLNGSAPENSAQLQHTLPIEVPAGHYLMLRWKDADELESDHGLAIDDVSITWHTQPQPMLLPAPLPVELVYFKANLNKEHVELRWQTASEDRNSHFVVERSHDGKHFEGVGLVTGKGTTVQTTHYTYLDLSPLPGTSYYRLKQVDEDESYTYSNLTAITRKVAQGVAVYPTITSRELELKTDVRLQHAVVADTMGRKLLEWSFQPTVTKYSLNVSDLVSGTYLLLLVDETGSRHTRRFVKQ